tara:strand:+ start:1189 stop:1770 length:582 start_codon:yes stop_codon:yes gene_type:complete
MAATASTMLPLGTPAPDFQLPDTDGTSVSLADLGGSQGLVVAFISNHCPFVKHLRLKFAALADEFLLRGVSFVAIGSNDVANYPDDGPDKMAQEKNLAGYNFPYLYDEDQKVAKAYRAACTPDFYLFDGNRRLAYRGQFDDSRPGNGRSITGKDLRGALEAVLAGESVPEEKQKPSLGCNIKWKAGNAPDYYG